MWGPNFRTLGHSWSDFGFPRRVGAVTSPKVRDNVFEFADFCEKDAVSGVCKEVIFPDLWRISGRFFQLNGSTPQSINDTLLDNFGSGDLERAGAISGILKDLGLYEIEEPEDWDNNDDD